MNLALRAPAFLASVTSADEASIACAGGADIIDAKNPETGALGALPVATVAAIRAAVPRNVPVSATIGDLPFTPRPITGAVTSMAESGCDLIKIGIFPGGEISETLAALQAMDLGPVKLVGLLLADHSPDFAWIDAMAGAGFAGVMLDTAAKSQGSLRAYLDANSLARFIAAAHERNLFAGLAGSLRLSDVVPLTALAPDVLGFRGALCDAGVRTGTLDAARVQAVRLELDRAMGARATGSIQEPALV